MLYFLHGFLGSPKDWDEVLLHLPCLWQTQAVDLTHALPTFAEDAIIVGYSMGGRIALQLNHPGGLVLLGAHFGLATQEEKSKRAEEERLVLQEMKECPDRFLEKWYAQPLFKTLPMDSALLERRRSIDFSKHAALYEQFALSRQPLTLPPPHALLLYGERDEKYANLYRRFPNAKSIPNAGHAVHIENPKAVAVSIQHYIEVCHASRRS